MRTWLSTVAHADDFLKDVCDGTYSLWQNLAEEQDGLWLQACTALP